MEEYWEKEEEEEEEMKQTLEGLPEAVVSSMIMGKLDISSICSMATTCKTFNSCAYRHLSFLPNFDATNIAPSIGLLIPLLPTTNPNLHSLKLNCKRLDDSSINHILRPSLQNLCLQHCQDFSGKLLYEIGTRCRDLRCLYLGSVADGRNRRINISDLEELLSGCTHLQSLFLMFSISMFRPDHLALDWTMALPELVNLEIGEITSAMMIELLSPTAQLLPSQLQPTTLPNIRKLCISVDCITDALVGTISRCLLNLIHLDLEDAPFTQPNGNTDLSNSGVQDINQNGRLKYLSLVRSPRFCDTSFRQVNDVGILLMAFRSLSLESISLGGFCRVSDGGFRAVLHSCPNLQTLKIFHGGIHLTDLMFDDISATSLSLTTISLRWCNWITSQSVVNLALKMDLKVLDLRGCRNCDDEALKAISVLHKLKTLLLDGTFISDTGFTYVGDKVLQSLTSLSIRGCRGLTDKCIASIFNGSDRALQNLDLSYLPKLTDNGILFLAKAKFPIIELRMRKCPHISDTSIMALASMQVKEGGWSGSGLQVLDLYRCSGITPLVFPWFKKPNFPRLRWFGIPESFNKELILVLERSRPALEIACRGEELGRGHWCSSSDGLHDGEEEVDELGKWLPKGDVEVGIDDEDLYEDNQVVVGESDSNEEMGESDED